MNRVKLPLQHTPSGAQAVAALLGNAAKPGRIYVPWLFGLGPRQPLAGVESEGPILRGVLT